MPSSSRSRTAGSPPTSTRSLRCRVVALAFSYMKWAASPSSAGAVRPPAEMLAGNVNNTKQRLLGYVVALHHETDYRFVYHFVERRLGATLSVTPHVSSAIFEVKAGSRSGSCRSRSA